MEMKDWTWAELNAWVMNPKTTEPELVVALAAEMKGKCRKIYVMRINSRLNKLRLRRETAALKRRIGG